MPMRVRGNGIISRYGSNSRHLENRRQYTHSESIADRFIVITATFALATFLTFSFRQIKYLLPLFGQPYLGYYAELLPSSNTSLEFRIAQACLLCYG